METTEIEKLCKEALDKFPDKVNNYKLGKVGSLGLFLGEVMKKSKGLAPPRQANSILIRLLNN